MFRKKTLFGVFFFLWLVIIVVNVVREMYSVHPLVRSRHNFHHKCSSDLAYRVEYLEACVSAEMSRGNQPTNMYADVLMEAIPRVHFFVFFEFNDLFSVQSLMKIVSLAVCKTLLGDFFTGIFRRKRNQSLT